MRLHYLKYSHVWLIFTLLVAEIFNFVFDPLLITKFQTSRNIHLSGAYPDICSVPVIEGSSTFVPSAISEAALSAIGGTDMTIAELCPIQCIEDCTNFNPTTYYEFEGTCTSDDGDAIAGYITYMYADTDPVCEQFCNFLCSYYRSKFVKAQPQILVLLTLLLETAIV